MRLAKIVGLLIAMMWCLSAYSQTDPNIGFCAAPASASACQGQPDTNPISGTSFGMWSFGNNASTDFWNLLVAVPQTAVASITAPTITETNCTTCFSFSTSVAQLFYLPSNMGNSIYDLAGLGGNSSMNASNMFGSLEQAAFGGKPADFDILLYTVTGSIPPGTALSFSTSGLPAGTFLAASAVDTQGASMSTPFTTTGLVVGGVVPDGGMTLMLLGGALVGVETLRRKLRI